MTTDAPAAWYPDPGGCGRWWYFDGTTWTDHYGPEPSLSAFF
jgi:hypothetical protein